MFQMDLATSPRKAQVGDWVLGPTIGNGSYGIVRECINAITGLKAAMKIVDLTRLSKESEHRSLRREIAIHSQLRHPNITEVYEVLESDTTVYIVMELVEGGDLFHYVTASEERLPESQVQLLFWQILSALSYCHANGVAHRDLKLENFLLTRDRTSIKLTDFGFSARFDKDGLLSTSCGSPHYVAPEILQGKPYDGARADMWSFGITLFAMLTNRMPFLDTQGRLVLARALRGLEVLPSWLNPIAGEVLKRLLEPDRYKRVTAEQLMSHPWALEAREIYERHVQTILQKQQKSLSGPRKRRFSLLSPRAVSTTRLDRASTITADTKVIQSAPLTLNFHLSFPEAVLPASPTTPRSPESPRSNSNSANTSPSSSPPSSPTISPRSPKGKNGGVSLWKSLVQSISPRRARGYTS
jgi:serine/threonine protein kinase